MTECNSHETHNINLNLYSVSLNAVRLNAIRLNDQQHFRLNEINETKDYFVAEIKERGLMRKRFSKYIASLDYLDMSLIVLSVTAVSISIASFATVIGAPVGIVSAIFSLAFSVSTGMIKKLLKTTRNKKKKHNKTVMLARSKLNSTKGEISKVLINNEINRDDFITIINEERNYRELKESVKKINSQRSNNENINLVQKGKKIGIDEVIKHDEIINKSLKSQI